MATAQDPAKTIINGARHLASNNHSTDSTDRPLRSIKATAHLRHSPTVIKATVASKIATTVVLNPTMDATINRISNTLRTISHSTMETAFIKVPHLKTGKATVLDTASRTIRHSTSKATRAMEAMGTRLHKVDQKSRHSSPTSTHPTNRTANLLQPTVKLRTDKHPMEAPREPNKIVV